MFKIKIFQNRPINLSANSLIYFFSPKGGEFDKCRKYSTNRPFYAKQSQISHQKSEYRIQNTEDKNAYKYLPNKELRSANFLDVSQDVIKNQHKNKAKTNPNKANLKNAQNECKLNQDR